MIITFAQIKEVTGLAAIVSESRKVTPFLVQAQFELRKMLGRTLYDELQDAVDNSFAGEAALSTLFTDYIKTPLAWRTLQYSNLRLHHEPTANGVHNVQNAEYSPVDGKTLGMDIAQARSFADTGYDEMIQYLQGNPTLFPSFATNVASEERVTKTYKGGVITRKSRWQYPYGLKTGRDGRNQYDEGCCE